ncbi:MAG: zinc ribbon domain-containing protein [Erysipelotrichaceae bacterium]|nr:zinc ribbon domain-containing protein [Erysipelotrichaceae bacterium]
MVNCKKCGAPLSLEQAVCPYCGTPNPEAQEHLEKLKQLDKDFNKAKKEVKEEVRQSKRGYNVLVVLVMLLLANLLLIPFHGASYEISERIIASKMSKHDVKATLDELLAKGEYIEMSIFIDRFYLPYSEYGEYNRLAYLASDYDKVIENVTLYQYADDPYSDPLVRACQYIKEFSDEYARYLKWDVSEEFLPHYKKLYTEFSNYLKTYLKLTDEDIASLSDLNDSQILVLVDRRLNDEE